MRVIIRPRGVSKSVVVTLLRGQGVRRTALDKERPYGAAGIAYFDPTGKLLLCLRSDDVDDHAREWGFPAGSVERGESVVAAAVREFYEETGHRVSPRRIAHIVKNGDFTCAMTNGPRFVPRLDREHTTYAWFDLEDLPDNVHPGVLECFNKLPVSSDDVAEMVLEEIGTISRDAWEEIDHPRDEDGKFAANGGSASKPTKATASGAKGGVHELLTSGHAFSVEELMAATGASKASVTTALSDLKNPKYAGRLGHLMIEKRSDGLYHVKKAENQASAASKEEPSGKPTSAGLEAAAEAVVNIHGRQLPVVLNKADARSGDKLVMVNVEKFDEAWQRSDRGTAGFYIGRGGTGSSIGDRYDRFHEFAKSAPSMEASDVHVDENGRIGFGNGRHRFSVLRDAGNKVIPVAMSAEAEANARKHGYIHQPPPTVVRVDRSDPLEGVKHVVKLHGDDREFPIVRADNTMGLGYEWQPAVGGAWEDYAMGPAPSQNGYINMSLGSTKEEALKNIEGLVRRLDASPHYKRQLKPKPAPVVKRAAAVEPPPSKPAIEWRAGGIANTARADLPGDYKAHRTKLNNGNLVYHVRGGGMVYEHTIRTDEDGTILRHTLTTPHKTQSVKGPVMSTSSRDLGGTHRARFRNIYKLLGVRETAPEATATKVSGAQRPTFRSLMDSVHSIEDRKVRDEVDEALDSARINADDTIHQEKAAPESEWENLAHGSLQSHLSFASISPAAVEWFKKQGVVW